MNPTRPPAAPVLALTLALVTGAATAEPRILTVYTYDSFVTEWGPGPAIEQGFEALCGCDLRWVTAGDGAALLSRLRLEGARTRADVVVGLDTNLITEAAASALFAPVAQDAPYDLPVEWDDELFVPYDWGYFAFVFDRARVPEPPANFPDLAASDLRIVIQDPRSSTPGLGLVLWVKAAHGAQAGAIWEALADNVVTVTPGWSEAYALFLAGEADMVLSYTTSPAYHLIVEGDDGKAAARFDEGHYLQIEVAGRIASSEVPDLAEAFLAYLVSDAAQAVIPTTNWMYPAVTPAAGLPEGFATLMIPDRALLFAPREAQELRGPAIEEWRAALSR